MLIYCFSELCCCWSSCSGLFQSFLETALAVLYSWQIHRQGLHNPKEAEESWVMMAQTFCHLDGDLGSPWGPFHPEDAQRCVFLEWTGSPSSPLYLGRVLVHLQPTLTALSDPGSQQMVSHHVSNPPECNSKASLASPPHKPHCPHTYITHRLRS